MKKTLVRSLAMAFVGSLLMAGSALALPTLTLSDGTTTKTVTDGTGNPLDGILTYNSVLDGVIGDWIVDVSTGLSPVPGSLALPHMDLNSINVFVNDPDPTKNPSSVLTITLSDFVTPSPGVTGAVAAVGGTNNQTTSLFQVYYGTTPTLMSTLGAFNAAGYSDTDGFAYVGGPTNISLVATLTALGSNGSGSFDFELTPVPEPATMLLLGTGLAGLAGARRRRANKA